MLYIVCPAFFCSDCFCTLLPSVSCLLEYSVCLCLLPASVTCLLVCHACTCVLPASHRLSACPAYLCFQTAFIYVPCLLVSCALSSWQPTCVACCLPAVFCLPILCLLALGPFVSASLPFIFCFAKRKENITFFSFTFYFFAFFQ
jgi:hypothetical protein